VYCDIITADFVGGVCSGRTVSVVGGSVRVDIPGGVQEDSMIAIHVQVGNLKEGFLVLPEIIVLL